MKFYQKILLNIIIGILIIPTIAAGGSIAKSLLQGKGMPEALQVLAEQIDSLLGRVEQVEEEQRIIQTQLEKERACNEYNRILAEIKDTCGNFPHPGINGCTWYYQYLLSLHPNDPIYEKRLNKLEELKSLYQNAAEGCGISLEEENQRSEEWINEYACHTVKKKFEGPIQELQNQIQMLQQEYVAKTNYCESFIINIPQECLAYKSTDQELDCCYLYSPPEEYPEGLPKQCCMFFYYGEENFNKTLTEYNNQLEELQSNPEYLWLKEYCVE